jgi:hypothetical protein
MPSHIQQSTKKENTNKLKRGKEEEKEEEEGEGEAIMLVTDGTTDKFELSRKRKVSQAALSATEVDGFAPSGVFMLIY